MSQKTLNLCLERYNFVKFGETTKSSHTVLCINNAYSVNSDKYRLTPAAIASKHGEGYVFTLNYDFDRPLFTIVQKSYALDGTSGNIVFEGIDPISKGGSKYLRKVTVSPVKLSDGSYLLEVTNDEYLRIGTTGAALGDEELESLNEKIVATGGIEKSVETVGGKQILKLDASGSAGAKEIVYFDVDPSDPPSGIYEAIGEALSNNKLPAIRSDGKLYTYTSTETNRYVFVGVFSNDGVGYEIFDVYTDDNVYVDAHKASLGYAALPSSGTEEHPAWAKVCELEPKAQQSYTTYGLALLFTGEHPNDDDKNTESGILAIDVGSDWSNNSNCCNASWMAYTPGSEYSKILGIKLIGKYGVPSNPVSAPYPIYKIEVWVKYYGSHNILVNALQNAMYFTGMVQSDFFKFPEGHIATPQSTEPSYSDTEEYVYKNFFYPAESPSVAYTHPQSLTSPQQTQGRDNIGAASAADVTALQSQVSSLSDVSAYTVKGEATVAQLNAGPSGIQAGWAYQLTDSGTLTEGSLAVVAGDTVAWDGTKWFPLVKSDYYATKTYAQNVAHSIAPEYNGSATAGKLYMHEGALYRCKENCSGEWIPANFVPAHVDERIEGLPDSLTTLVDYSSLRQNSKSINTSGDIGSTVDLTPVTTGGFACYVMDVKKYDYVVIKGVGGENGRLWCFVDTSDKIVSHADSNATISVDTLFLAPVDGKVIVNTTSTADNVTFKVGDAVYHAISKIDKTTEGILDRIAGIPESLTTFVDYSSIRVLNKRIDTSGAIGSTLDYTATTAGGWKYYIKDVKKNDYIKLKGSGGSSGRLWCFVDTSDKIVSHADSNISFSTAKILVAPVDGKVIINTTGEPSNDIFEIAKSVKGEIDGLRADDAGIYEQIQNNALNLSSFSNRIDSGTNNKTINTSGAIGSTVDYTLTTSGGFKAYVNPVKKGDYVKIKGTGGSNGRLWCFVDTSDKIISHADSNVSVATPIILIAPADGKVIANITTASGPVLEILSPKQFRVPLTHFEFLRDTYEDDDVSDFDFSDKTNIMFGIYDLFDELVTNYGGLITKVDALEQVNLEYPEYANGVSGSEDYQDTPAYKTYMYVIKDTNAKAGNSNGQNTKKKLLLYGGAHGNEYMGQFDTYLFAKNLLSVKNADYFKLLSTFDIYIIPVLNGYGSIHEMRSNADWTDIERNFPFPGWKEEGNASIGDQYTCQYTGPSAGSAVETQLIMELCKLYNFDVVVDHHNYGAASNSSSSWSVYYVEAPEYYQLSICYQSLINTSAALKKAYPQYFGAGFGLLMRGDTPAAYAPARVTGVNTNGYSKTWIYNNPQYAKIGLIIESCDSIFLANGEYVGQTNRFGKPAFAISELILRDTTLRMCEYALNYL